MLADQAGTVRARRDLSRSYQKMGDIAQALGNMEEAQEWYEKSREIRCTVP